MTFKTELLAGIYYQSNAIDHDDNAFLCPNLVRLWSTNDAKVVCFGIKLRSLSEDLAAVCEKPGEMSENGRSLSGQIGLNLDSKKRFTQFLNLETFLTTEKNLNYLVVVEIA